MERYRPGLPCEDLRLSVGMRPEQRLILSVGRLSRRKGFDMVIRSMPELARRGIDARYVLVGIGEDREYLEVLARELGVENRVHLIGHAAPEDLPRWYNACDVFAMPNREINGDTEGFGMVFIEAAACGKAVISGQAGGTGDAVLDGVTGLRVNGADPAAVADALSSLLLDGEILASMGQRGFRRAMQEFAWDKVADKTRNNVMQGR